MRLIPANRAKFGSHQYFVTVMKAGEAIQGIKIPKEDDDWDNLTIEEKYQREINYNRVKKHIAPYLIKNEDRFFGSLICYPYNETDIKFQSFNDIHDFGNDVFYKTASEDAGFIIWDDGLLLRPLDGQHRLCALKFAILGKDERNRDIQDFAKNDDLANEQIAVIIIDTGVAETPDEKNQVTASCRAIFNKINRYAKPTTKADNLITSDDDVAAVIVRNEICTGIIADRLVNAKSNTISATSPFFTTLGTLYDSVVDILKNTYGGNLDLTTLPDEDTAAKYIELSTNIWDGLTSKLDLYISALSDTEETGDSKRKELRAEHTLLKPVVQRILVNVFLRLDNSEKNPAISRADIYKRVNETDWSFSNTEWDGILHTDGGSKIIAGKDKMNFATNMVAYLLGDKCTEQEINNLKEIFGSIHAATGKTFPNPKY